MPIAIIIVVHNIEVITKEISIYRFQMTTEVGFQIKYIKVHTPQMIDLKLRLPQSLGSY